MYKNEKCLRGEDNIDKKDIEDGREGESKG
jgi:hypothetical protein